MWGDLIEHIISVITGVAVAVIGMLVKDNLKLRKERKMKQCEEEKAEDDLLLCLSRLTLLESVKKATKRGYTTIEEHDVISQLYKAYIQKGGNGTVKHVYDSEYEKLEIK